MKGVIDRFEGDRAVVVLEDGDTIDIRKDQLPQKAKPGSAICIDGNVISYLLEETEAREKRVKELVEDLFED